MLVSEDLQVRWWKLEEKLIQRFGKKPDLESILFLIGVQEVGGAGHQFTKEQKQDLMHVAVCSILSASGWDQDGWPHFKQLKELPSMSLMEQENFMKDHVLFYFSQNALI
jgi:hypothetical protein